MRYTAGVAVKQWGLRYRAHNGVPRWAVVIVPDRRRDGTNVLSRPASLPLRAEYGRGSFGRHLQSALGTGAGYVALLLLAYEQIGSAWGATAVLIADLAPAMLLGPLLGGLIDRTSRLGCAVAADVLGALAFAALVFAHGTVALVALALAAGIGTALLRPAPPVVNPS